MTWDHARASVHRRSHATCASVVLVPETTLKVVCGSSCLPTARRHPPPRPHPPIKHRAQRVRCPATPPTVDNNHAAQAQPRKHTIRGPARAVRRVRLTDRRRVSGQAHPCAVRGAPAGPAHPCRSRDAPPGPRRAHTDRRP